MHLVARLCPYLLGGAYSAPPDLIAGLRGEEKGGKWRSGRERGEGEGKKERKDLPNV